MARLCDSLLQFPFNIYLLLGVISENGVRMEHFPSLMSVHLIFAN